MNSIIKKLKNSNSILGFSIQLFLIILVFIGMRHYYLNHIKYAELEDKIIEIHASMEQDFPKEALSELEHFGVGMSIRNKYNLWSEESEISKVFEKYGVSHPDDMSGIIMETYIRSKLGVSFKLYRLIKLNVGFYESPNKERHMEKMVKEFLSLQ